MTTARQIIRLAFMQANETGVGEEPTAADAADCLSLLNQMMYSWANENVDVFHSDLTLASELLFWVPPKDADGATIDAAAYQGTWNASTNTPALVSSIGTSGHVYKVATAGTTTLDDGSTWAVGDFVVFDGVQQKWLKCRSSKAHEHGITAMLAVRMAPMFSGEINPVTAAAAASGWRQLQAAFVVAPIASVDDALRRMTGNRYINGNLL